MANATTYGLDPNWLTQQAVSGRAQLIPDSSAAFWATLAKNVNRSFGYQTVDTTGTSLDVSVYRHELAVSGTMTGTLPDGTYVGQRVLVMCASAASIPAYTLTVTTPETATGYACSSTWFFDTAGQGVEFEWTVNSKWKATQVFRAGGVANNVTVGSTVLTGKVLWRNYFLSISGTVSSTGNQGIPNGSAIGERCLVSVSNAASIPSGTIAVGAAITNAGSSGAKTLGTGTATSHYAEMEWDGQFWCVVGNSTLVLS